MFVPVRQFFQNTIIVIMGMFTIILIVGGCVAAVVVVLLLCAMCRTCEADSSRRMEVKMVVRVR